MIDGPPNTVAIRRVQTGDLPFFYEHQRTPEATETSGFPCRDCRTFMRHWERVLEDGEIFTRTILFNGEVAGHIASAVYSDIREVSYWLGREFWSKGVATRGLAAFLRWMTVRPVYAHVATHNVASIRVLQKNGFEVVRRERILLVMKLAGSEGNIIESNTTQ